MKPSPLSMALASLLLAAPALAQTNPTFTFVKPDAPKPAEVAKPATPPPPPPPPVEWKVQAKGGFTMTTGNSQTIGGVVGGTVSRKEANNRLTLDGGAAYGRSSVIQPMVTPAAVGPPATPPTITMLSRNDIETTNNWFLKGRYDRFFTLNNSGYVSAQVASDKIAGKSLFGGGQIGYSRQLYKTPMHLAVAEIGYDLSYESYVQVPDTDHPAVTIHSARLFAGETLTLTPSTGITASIEALFNLNRESEALNVSTAMPGVDPFKDTRVNGKVGFTTTVFKRLSVGFGVTVRYDQNPAPLPIPSGVPAGTVFAASLGTPFAEKVDTLTEATVIYTFF